MEESSASEESSQNPGAKSKTESESPETSSEPSSLEENPGLIGPMNPSHVIQNSLMASVAEYYSAGNWIPDLSFGLPADFAEKILGESLSDYWGMENWADSDRKNFIDTIIGAFQGTEVAGKLQHGSAWWFNDNKTGMREQLISLANLSILGNFVGMLTDSRSFLSYTRHEYFRRILCELIGEWVENGEYPDDDSALGEIIRGICYENAKKYFKL